MGLGDFMKDVGSAGVNVGKGVGWALDPRHQDDIARGIGKTAQFVAENPGVIKDVGVAIAKEQLKPQNLAINAGLLALTAATGGAAAPAALAARTAFAARSAKMGVTAVKAIENTQDVVQAARTAEKVVEGVQTAKQAGALARGVDKINDVRSAVSPITTRSAAFRTQMGEKVLAGAGPEGAGFGRQALANVVQGTKGIGAPARMVGQSDTAYQAQKMTRYARMGQGAQGTAQATGTAVQAAANPQRAAMKAATQAGKARYGEQFGEHTGEEYVTTSGGQAVLPGSEGLEQPSVSANGVPQPQAMRDVGSIANPFAGRKMTFQTGSKAKAARQGGNRGSGKYTADDIREAMKPSQHMWQGANREALGGIGVDYDWRTFQQRPMHARPIGKPIKIGFSKREDEGEDFDPDYRNEQGIGTAKGARKGTENELAASNVSMQYSEFGPEGQAIRMKGRGENFVEGSVVGEGEGQTITGTVNHNQLQGTMMSDLQEPTATNQPGATANVVGSAATSPMYDKPALPDLMEPTTPAKPKFTNRHGRGPGR